jgi:hypothetical protein
VRPSTPSLLSGPLPCSHGWWPARRGREGRCGSGGRPREERRGASAGLRWRWPVVGLQLACLAALARGGARARQAGGAGPRRSSSSPGRLACLGDHRLPLLGRLGTNRSRELPPSPRRRRRASCSDSVRRWCHPLAAARRRGPSGCAPHAPWPPPAADWTSNGAR